MSPTALARDDAHRAARAMERAHGNVLSADVSHPATEPTDRWTVEATVVDTDGVPPAVLSALAEHGLELRHAGPRAPDVFRVVAVA